MHISYAQMLARRVPLSVVEAVALADAAAVAADHADIPAVPPAEQILLHHDGAVTFASGAAEATDDTGSDRPASGEREDRPQADAGVRALGALLYRLLRLDSDGEADALRPTGIQGALMLMLARVRGEIDLPAPSLHAFRNLLARHGSSDPAMIAAIYRRAAMPKPTPKPARLAVPPLATPARTDMPAPAVRRAARIDTGSTSPAVHPAHLDVPPALHDARIDTAPTVPAPARIDMPPAVPSAARIDVPPAAPTAPRIDGPSPAVHTADRNDPLWSLTLHDVPRPTTAFASPLESSVPPPPARRARRSAWLVPASAFAAGCVVATSFVVFTGWTPAKSVVTAMNGSRMIERSAGAAPATVTGARAPVAGSPSPVAASPAPAAGGRASAPTRTEPTTATTAGATAGATDATSPGHDVVADRRDTAAAPDAAALPTSGRVERAPTPLIDRTFITDAFSPSFAADGEVLFHLSRTDGRLMKASIANSGAVSVTPLVDDAAANFHGVMSPDGTALAFDSDRDGTRGIYIAAADGTAPRRVSGSGFATTPSWSPDGKRLAFVKAEPGHSRVWNVWIADLRSGSLTRVSHHRVGQAWRPSWLPDGQRLVYSVEDDLIVADLARHTSRTIRSPEPGRLVRTPAVSPDGRRIVFQVRGDGVWLFDLEKGTMQRVLADRTAEEFSWSPDGKRIAFHARRVGRWSLWQLAI